MKYKHTVDTAVDPMPMVDILPVRPFISSILVAQTGIPWCQRRVENQVFHLWTVVWERKIKLSIEV